MIFFSFCFLFVMLNLYRGFIAVLKYVRSYLHSLGLVTETNKNNILFTCFSVMPDLFLKPSFKKHFLPPRLRPTLESIAALFTSDHQVSLQHLCTVGS